MSASTLTFPEADARKLEPYLPPAPKLCSTAATAEAAAASGAQDDDGVGRRPSRRRLPFVTLTYATSLDSALALAPGTRTALSGPQSKAMTHYLRSRHAAICVGVGTALADDPGLNCRIISAAAAAAAAGNPPPQQPRPIIIDPRQRWAFTSQSKVMQLARAGRGLAPYILIAAGGPEPPAERRRLLEELGGKYITLGGGGGSDDDDKNENENENERNRQQEDFSSSSFVMEWRDILGAVQAEGLDSIMVEGGGHVISSLLAAPNADLIDAVVVTVAPTWLGAGSVFVAPARRRDGEGRPVAAGRLVDTAWIPLGEDVVLCGRIAKQKDSLS